MEKSYNHHQHESEIYQLWEKSNAFNPDSQLNSSKTDQPGNQATRQPFSIIMPPPNANDPLHIGHAMFVALEDILIRYHRMKGDDTVWIPGTDHAGIETQYVFEKKLSKQGKSRFQFDRKTLYQQIWQYVQDNSGVAVDQMKKLGASADWSRFKFTLNPEIVEFVLNTFQQLHRDGLVYRDLKLVNYCTKCGTSYSELEVNHVEQTTKLYYLKYGPFTLATTRPETKFADTAVAVHPEDSRYKEYIGQEIEVEGLLGKFKMKVVADEYVDREFGTGVVKITPYHDFNDFEVWQRHKDEMPVPKQVIGLDGKLTEIAGPYTGMRVKAAREQIEKDLEAKGLLAQPTKQDYNNTIRVCYKCGTVIEPLPLPQFFIKVKPLTQKALDALDKKQTIIHGAGREKILRHWLENLKDWNISRQIVWGIRLPVWYSVKETPNLDIRFIDSKGEQQKGTVQELLKTFSFEEIEKGLQELHAPADAEFIISTTDPRSPTSDLQYLQETDTFDTWFSSAQWPVVTLKVQGSRFKVSDGVTELQSHKVAKSQNPSLSKIQDSQFPDTRHLTTENRSTDFDRFYPTSVMETGYDILPFWVMRMMMLGIYLTGKTPFQHVYLHGLVRDEKGQKMSKSKGNVINPLDLVEKYGADALRMALVMSSTPGNDSSMGETKVRGMRNFSNKIWNAARFIIMNQEGSEFRVSGKARSRYARQGSKPQDNDFRKHLTETVQQITKQLEDLKIGLATETVYNEFWHWFCDECIEKAKKGELSWEDVTTGLLTFLKLLHPFVPFVTEAVWQELKKAELIKENELLITATWPN